jgi:hypothetical protein
LASKIVEVASKYPAYEVAGQTIFPIYAKSGGLYAKLVVYLYTGRPSIMESGSNMPVAEGLTRYEGGSIYTIEVPYFHYGDQEFLDKKIMIAEEALGGE